jgi:membrane fusion protein (multidrug efflux system)
VIILLAIAGVVTGGLWLFHHIHTYEDTDDAQVDADVSAISPRITGTVTGVYVVDNQIVHAGDLLVEMDVPDYEVALEVAKANLEQAKAQAKSEAPNVPITDVTNTQNIATSGSDVSGASSEAAAAERDYIAAMAKERAAEADYQNALLEQQRSQKLVQSGAVSSQDYDTHTTTAAKSLASLDAARAATQASLNRQAEARSKLADAISKSAATRANAPRQLEAQKATVASREAQVLAAQAQLDQAELNLKYTKIYAPVDGIIGKKSVNIGDRISPGQELFALVQTKNLWVTADYRETQLTHMHPGERAKIHVDALDLDFNGSVQSMPGATGAIYSLLPPENATGNYVKVVQRLPVRIQIDANQVGYDRLRPGMSVEPTVYLQ